MIFCVSSDKEKSWKCSILTLLSNLTHYSIRIRSKTFTFKNHYFEKIICSWGKSVGNGFLFRFNWIVGNNLLLSEKSLFIEQNCWNYFIQILAKLKLFYLTLEHWKLSKYSFSGLVFKKRMFKNKLKISTN